MFTNITSRRSRVIELRTSSMMSTEVMSSRRFNSNKRRHGTDTRERDTQKFSPCDSPLAPKKVNPVPRLWRAAKSLPLAQRNKPLSGLKIALDPGHLGGNWAKMEERWFQVGDSKPVQEGDLTLSAVAIIGDAIARSRCESFVCSK